MNKINNLYVIDDDEIYQYLTNEIINSTQLVNNIKFFSNGSDAIEFLKLIKDIPEQLPEVILLDLFMPVLDGWGFLEKFTDVKLKINKKIIIYIISSSIDPEDVQKAKTISEVTDYIIKPLTREKFINSMKGLRF